MGLDGDHTCKGPRWEGNQPILGEVSGKAWSGPWTMSRCPPQVEKSPKNGRGNSICQGLGVCEDLGCCRISCSNVSSRKAEKHVSVLVTAASLAPRTVPMIHSCWMNE